MELTLLYDNDNLNAAVLSLHPKTLAARFCSEKWLQECNTEDGSLLTQEPSGKDGKILLNSKVLRLEVREGLVTAGWGILCRGKDSKTSFDLQQMKRCREIISFLNEDFLPGFWCCNGWALDQNKTLLKVQFLGWNVACDAVLAHDICRRKRSSWAFEPPLDLSQDINIDESEPLSDVSDNQPCVGEKTDGFCEHDKKSAIVSGTQTEGQNSGTTICRSSKEKRIGPLNEFSAGSCSTGSDYHADDAFVENQEILPSRVGCNGHVTSSAPDWLDPSLQLHVPLVDVDKNPSSSSPPQPSSHCNSPHPSPFSLPAGAILCSLFFYTNHFNQLIGQTLMILACVDEFWIGVMVNHDIVQCYGSRNEWSRLRVGSVLHLVHPSGMFGSLLQRYRPLVGVGADVACGGHAYCYEKEDEKGGGKEEKEEENWQLDH
ncbi:hypothetical protein M9H77_12372 [Catharanthus roseus]|uniref:Uncharacterized protein n=1 Tax=Catharanthus roseus TaxID=4058 RepID=A0ACC0BHE3_CATRO|nr:hypothetical protein M9H77_12372 [Catharanthus roseus]